MQNINMTLFMSSLCGFAKKTVRASGAYPGKVAAGFPKKMRPNP
jgi:hypothetical protein